MARTIAQWRTIIIDKKNAEAALTGLNSTSNVAEWNLWVNLLAFCASFLEGVFDAFKGDVNRLLAADKAHTVQWYVTKMKAFQYGVGLPPDTDVYAVVPPVDESVLIISSAAAVETGGLNILRIKVAKGEPGAREPLESGSELVAAQRYINRLKDAGVRVEVTSGPADDLKLQLNLFYDPLVINATGERIDGTADTPAKDAIDTFLANIPFNGVFVLNDLVDAIEATEGLVICTVVSASANYAATPYVDIPTKYVPDAGYLALNVAYFDTNVVYTPN